MDLPRIIQTGAWVDIPDEHIDRERFKYAVTEVWEFMHAHDYGPRVRLHRNWIGDLRNSDGSAIRLDRPLVEIEGRSLIVYPGFMWDGPSGPTWDSKSSMAASISHDALYRAMRFGMLNGNLRGAADHDFRDLCKAGGMNWFRRSYHWLGVRIGGRKSARRFAGVPKRYEDREAEGGE